MISLLLGLGNIGRKYVGTRHNLGFELLDRVAAELGVKGRHRTDLFDWAEARGNPSTPVRTRLWGAQRDDRRLILAWPRTYVNCSGDAAVKLLNDNSITADGMLVLVDDFVLPLGALRFRAGGSDGGHNGLASLIESLGTEEFPRLRMGIRPVDKSMDIVDYVFSKFTALERESADTMLDRAVEAVLFAIDHRLEEAMSKYNCNPAPPESA
jgi:PTH1 family peptidyl-tRNA hydrolase